MPNQSQLLSRLEREAVRLSSEMNLEYIDTEIVKEPTGRYLRIFIDKPGGITLDELEVFHKAIRPSTEEIDYDYMEVSSPGADRPLKKPRDFEHAMGSIVELKLYKPLNGIKQYKGVLVGFDGSLITLETENGSASFLQSDVAIVRPFIDVESELENAQD